PQDFAAHTHIGRNGVRILNLMVEGLHCAACVWLIEAVLSRQPGVVSARVNMTTRRLVLKWTGDGIDADSLIEPIGALGYRLVPFDPALLDQQSRRRERELLRAMAVAGFAAGNVMLLSVAVWAGHYQGMGPATRDLLHWISALVALPAVAYAGVPFFRSAMNALANWRVNMDVPISLAVVLASCMSLADTIQSREHAYFDSAITLLFFLLIGRYLDQRARGKARTSAEHLLALGATAVTVLDDDGERRLLQPCQVLPGMTIFAAAGERIAVDGVVRDGNSDIDSSLINGETTPAPISPGKRVYAGTLNLSAPVHIEVTAVGEDTLLAEIVRLVEVAERGRAKYVALADRVARWYAPVVHTLALVTFFIWLFLFDAAWRDALLHAIAVLIITCPCALALAVPVVQVVTSGRLLRHGILVKSGTALERLAEVNTVVFDKTGTLTTGVPRISDMDIEPAALELAASLAAASNHPLARALARAVPSVRPKSDVREHPGRGLSFESDTGEVRLGRRDWCGDAAAPDPVGPELWLSGPGTDRVCFRFTDRPKDDASRVISVLRDRGFHVEILSGDGIHAVAATADAVGIEIRRARSGPGDKSAHLQALAAEGRHVLMVGDGLNDAPALTAAHVSMSPSTAADVSQNAADIVFQGEKLGPVIEAIGSARRAGRLIRQNFAIAFLYNTLTIPLAVGGLVTPLIAAAAMSASSIAVIANALRLNRGKAL
ncbi:MAG: cadmium-translocating P-type ATPase, partial [Rhodospirillales bacterium]|nr:cadmium-translocating P-type ATPase [Rhodospirillales bacterium]